MTTLTEKIFQAKSPWNNPYQGNDKKVLFVCSAGILRSATAARIYAHKYNTRCAGSAEYALIPLSDDLLLWADEIVFVHQYNFLQTSFRFDLDCYDDKIKVLNIDDNYMHMDPQLIEEFKKQYNEF